jgi:hypothetical protein
MTENVIETFSSGNLLIAIRYYKRYFVHSPADSVCFQYSLLIGKGIPIDFTIVVEFVKTGSGFGRHKQFGSLFRTESRRRSRY